MGVLFIISSSDTAFWLSEITHPYWHFVERGIEVDFASPSGGKVVYDPYSDPYFKNSTESEDLVSKGFLSDKELVAKLESTLILKEVDLSKYDAVHRQTRRQSFAKECLCSGDAAIRSKQKIHRLAVLIDSAIKIIPLAPHFYISFVHAPGSIHWPCKAVPSLLELRHITTHPTKNRRVRHDNTALGHHRLEIPIAQSVGDVPAHT